MPNEELKKLMPELRDRAIHHVAGVLPEASRGSLASALGATYMAGFLEGRGIDLAAADQAVCELTEEESE